MCIFFNVRFRFDAQTQPAADAEAKGAPKSRSETLKFLAEKAAEIDDLLMAESETASTNDDALSTLQAAVPGNSAVVAASKRGKTR